MKMDRWSEYSFKNGQVARNRMVVPPMASQTADTSGLVTEKTREHYKRLTLSGAGILFVEYSFIHPTGKGEPHQLGVDQEPTLSGLTQIAKIIKDSGALAGQQIVHVGGKTTTELIGQKLLGPSAIIVPVKDRELERPQAMSLALVEEMIQWYLNAAQRVFQSGFDMVELHAAHGYGLNQWLSPLTNQRKDEYGGSMENRARMLLTVVKEVRKRFPEKLISVRLAAQDHIPGGLTLQDSAWVVQQLDTLGVDLIDVSSGIGGWRRPEGLRGEGYLVTDASELKKVTQRPVMGVGGIQSGEFIDQALNAGWLDFAAVGRAILQDPEGWNNKVLKTE